MNQTHNGEEVAGFRRTAGPDTPAMDGELVRAARRGDKRAFIEIVTRHQAMVCGIALGILGDFGASEDAAQEAFLTAWQKLGDLREPERLRGWLGQIARNAALGQMRRRRGHESLDETTGLMDGSPAPDQAAATEDEATVVRASLAKLPEMYRLPLILFYREEQSVRAVAQALDISEDAVKQRLARGREMLRDRMSGLIESVLTRTGPGPMFTIAIATAIGALAAPATVTGGVFAAAAGTGAAAVPATGASQILTLMSTSKTVLIAAALVTILFIPVGYQFATPERPTATTNDVLRVEAVVPKPTLNAAPSFETNPLFVEWRQLHQIHGTNSEAMPALFKAIEAVKDQFRRRAFQAALIAEWAQVDPPGGLKFFLGKGRNAGQRR